MKFIVVGSGLAGLTCAYNLKKQGHEVVVLEAASIPGGRTKKLSLGNSYTDAGTQFLSHSYKIIPALIEELGLKNDIVTAPFDVDLITDKGEFSLSPQKPFSLVAGGLLPAKDWFILFKNILQAKGKLKKINFEKADELKHLDEVTAEEFLKRHMPGPNIKALFETFFSGFAYARSHQLSEAMVYRVFGHLMEMQRSYSLKDTLFSITKKIADQVDIRYNSAVTKISHEGNQIKVHFSGQEITADKVVIATTASVAKKIYQTSNTLEQHLLATEYSSSAVYGVLVPRMAPLKSWTYATMFSPEAHPNINVCTYERMKNPFCSSDKEDMINILSTHEGFSLPEAEFKKQICELIEKRYGVLPSSIIAMERVSWKEAIPNFTAGKAKHIAEYRKSLSRDSKVFLAGDYMGTPCSEGAAESGKFIASIFGK